MMKTKKTWLLWIAFVAVIAIMLASCGKKECCCEDYCGSDEYGCCCTLCPGQYCGGSGGGLGSGSSGSSGSSGGGGGGGGGFSGPSFTVTFDCNGGNPVAAQRVAGNGKVNPVSAIKPLTAGLYLSQDLLLALGPPPYDNHNFDGWYHEAGLVTPWDFVNDAVTADITLYAKWSPDPDVEVSDLTPQAGGVKVDAAIAYAKANAGTYTLLIDQNIELGPQSLNVANVDLTIASLRGAKEIKLSQQGRFFNVGAAGQSNISLTLGNITLRGLSTRVNSDSTDNIYGMIKVSNGAEFVMLPGSKITGNEVVGLYGAGNDEDTIYVNNSTFRMEGGEIFDNINESQNNVYTSGGVYISNGGRLLMSGGRIYDNLGPLGDVYVGGNSTSIPTLGIGAITLSGNAEIEILMLNCFGIGGVNNNTCAVIDRWTGKVDQLWLRGSAPAGSPGNVTATIGSEWSGEKVLESAGDPLSSTQAAKFTLGDFQSSDGYSWPIYYSGNSKQNYEIQVPSGALVPVP